MYRIIYPEVREGIRMENRFVDLIFNRESFQVDIASGESGPEPGFGGSLENEVYLEFVTFQLAYEASLPEAYSVPEKYESLQLHRRRFMDSLTSLYPDLYAVKIMNAFRAPVVSSLASHPERIDTLRKSFFSHAAIDDPALLHAPVYTFRIIDYLSLFRNGNLDMEEQEALFIEAVDGIMANVGPEPELREFALNFLLEGFELLGMEQVQVHLIESYDLQSCNSEMAGLVESRIEGYKRMTVGSGAPDLVLRHDTGESLRLSEMESPLILLLFWASTCPHCREFMDQLGELYPEEHPKGLEVLAVSLDTSALAYEQYVTESNFPWITLHDPMSWKGKVASDYHLYATPSMFLLDSSLTILSRPGGYRQLIRALRKVGN